MTWDGMERRRWRPKAWGPYVAMALLVIAGFFVQGHNSDRIEREAILRDRAICQDGNDRAAAVVSFVRRLVEEFDLSPVSGEQLVALAERSFPQDTCPDRP